MGDLDFTVRVKTEYQDPTSLMEALGRSVKQGCFRVPARLSGGRPFVLVLATRAGTAAVKGTAEVVRQDGETTWVRFLSSSVPIADADIVLDDVDISVFPPEAITHPIRALSSSRSAQGSQSPVKARETAKAQGTGKSAALPPPSRPGTEDQQTAKRPVQRLATEDQQTAKRPAERPRTGQEPAQPGVLRTGQQPALAKNPKTGQSAALAPGEAAKTKTGQTSAITSAALPALPITRTGQSAVTPLPAPLPTARPGTGKQAAAARPGTGKQAAAARPGTGKQAATAPAAPARSVAPVPAEPAPAPAPALTPMSTDESSTPAQNAARRVARYSQQPRTRMPSRHPRGLQMMPALSIDQDAPAQETAHHHTLHDSPMGYGLPLAEVPSSSNAAPLPAPLSSNTAPLPEPPKAAAERPITGRGEAIVPLVSVVPWWNQPPEVRADDERPDAHDSADDGADDRADDRADDSADDSAGGSGDRIPSRRAATVNAARDEYPRPAPTHPRAATMSGAIEAIAPRGEHLAAMSGAPLVAVAFDAATETSAAPGAWPAGTHPEATRFTGERAVAIPAPPLAATRRVLWSSIAIAATCTAVAIAAIWWALDLRASSRDVSSRASSPAVGSRRLATPMRPNGSALGATASRPASAASSNAAAPPEPASTAPAPAPASAGLPTAAPQPCQLRISSNVNPAQIFVGGQPRGESPALLEAPCGPVSVELRHARYATASRKLEAVPGVITDVELKMARPLVTLRITSRPPGATVRLNGRNVGKTPLSTEVPAFERYTVVWSNRSGGNATQLIYPQSDSEEISATLLSSPWK